MPRRLLIVDDDADHPHLARRGARGQRHDAGGGGRRTTPGARACSIRATPDVVLSDVRMPDMDGIAFLKLLRERAPSIDVILMTAYDDMPTVVSAMREGAVEFLVKPLDLHQVRRVLDGVFEDRRSRARTPRAAARRPRPRRSRRPRSAHDRGLQAHRSGRGHPRHGADPRRERHRQGTRRARDSRQLGGRGRAVRSGQLRGAAHHAARIGTLRPHARRVHRRGAAPARAASRSRGAARSSSTRSATRPRSSRPSCCASSRIASSSRWARRRPNAPRRA